MDTATATTAASNGASAAPAASSAPASTATSTPVTTSSPASHSPVQDGNRGAGALNPAASQDAMLAAFEARATKDTPVTETPAAVVETPAVTETPAVEEHKDGEAADTEGARDVDYGDYSFEKDSFVGARDLAAKIEANPALAAALTPEIRNEIMANARMAEQLAPYRELFGSPDEAKIIAQTAQQHADVTHIFQSISTDAKKGTSDLISKMLEMSALRDDDGQPRRRQDGTYITDGTTTKFFNELFDRKFNASIVKKIQDSGDDAAVAALDLVMERAGLRTSTADKDQNADPELVARKAQLDAKEAEINRQQESQRQATVTQYTEALNGDLESLTNSEIDKVIGPATGLSKLARTSVVTNMTKAIRAAVKSNTAYRTEKAMLEAKPMTAKRRSEEVALAKRFFRDHLVTVATPILAEAGIDISNRKTARAATQAAREQAARGEVSGSASGSAQKAGDASNPAQTRAAAVEAFKAQNNGKNPNDSELNIFMMLNSPGLKKGRAA